MALPNNFEYHDVPETERSHHDVVDPHRGTSKIPEVILGGQDGLVNVLGVILGIAAATHDTRIILAGGLAAAMAESVAMAGVAYTSTRASLEHRESERRREHRHIAQVPTLERKEIQEIYRRKGFSGKLLERIVNRITADPEVWVAVMMAEEHHMGLAERTTPAGAALVVGLSALVGSLIPLLPFPLLSVSSSVLVSMSLSALTLFAVGWYKARQMVGHPLRSGTELATIGILSAVVGYLVGLVFRQPV